MKQLTYATVCSGIECMSVACRGLPLRPVFFSEIEPFPCAVLKAHYPDVPNLAAMRYIVRRLTPKEAERLMGLPDGYTIPAGLRHFFDANGEPSPELVAEFQRIHDTFGAIMADYAHKKPQKPKTAAQVQKWLAKITDPATCPDSPRYKGCGNGWATNQPRWILTRLLAIGEGIDPFSPDRPQQR